MAVLPTAVTVAISSFLMALIRTWRDHRNALPDEVRATLFWNDQRYAFLKGFLWAFGIFSIWFAGLVMRVW